MIPQSTALLEATLFVLASVAKAALGVVKSRADWSESNAGTLAASASGAAAGVGGSSLDYGARILTLMPKIGTAPASSVSTLASPLASSPVR